MKTFGYKKIHKNILFFVSFAFLAVIMGLAFFIQDQNYRNSVNSPDDLVLTVGQKCNERNLFSEAWSKLKGAFDIEEAHAAVTCADIQASIQRLQSLRAQILATTDLNTFYSLARAAMAEIDLLMALIDAAGLTATIEGLAAIKAEVAAVKAAVEALDLSVTVIVNPDGGFSK